MFGRHRSVAAPLCQTVAAGRTAGLPALVELIMPDQRPKLSRVTVEDLLRLKRSERPASEFWTEFERTLRQRQLAALVEKRSWWHHLAGGYGRVVRVGLPLGAVAILAVTFF